MSNPSSYVHYAGQAENGWFPISSLNRTDADVSLFLLAANGVHYEAPTNDPFYNATVPFELTGDGSSITYYHSDPTTHRWVNALACIDQYQYCNPMNKQCTTLSSSALAHKFLDENEIGLNDAQTITLLRLDSITFFLTTYNNVHPRGDSALRASETVNDLVQVGLPNDQWMTEVSSWFAVSMARLQQKVIQYATGPGYIPDGMYLSRPLERQEKMCKNQILRSSTATTSFSVLGVTIILIVGAALIPTSLILPSAVGFLRRLFKRKHYKSLQWTLDGKFQLQRLAYEEAGQGHWTGGADSVPLTRKHDVLGLPDGADPRHPRLSRMRRHSVSGSSRTPESESLMGDKRMRFKAEPMSA